ncbi:MAG: adenylate/guanylate cyclase domain-containing protein [Solirubrobacteraceae bacterium]
MGPPLPPHIATQLRATRGAVEGERKQVTVLFVDVKGSMNLSEAVDTEQWWAIMDRFFEILCDGVHLFDGRVERFTGDGMMAVFGAPLAREDHARLAAHAALHLNAELARYAQELAREQSLEFAVRTGLNSGEVVVGTIGDELSVEYAAIGHTAGLAQRMEGLAEPGKIFITESTAKLIEGYFRLREAGEFEVKGASSPLRVFELIGTGSVQTPLELARARGFSRFVGRESELGRLQSELERALAADARVVGLVGEPGIGKSRLGYEFVEGCRLDGLLVWQGYASAHTSAMPFVLVLELLRLYFEIEEGDDGPRTREKISERLGALEADFQQELPLLFDFLGVPDPERPLTRIDPAARQRQLFTMMDRLNLARSRLMPAVIVLEDLHWIDAGSEAFLESFIAGLAGTRTLLLVSFRPEYRAPWMESPHYTQLNLGALDRTAADVLFADLAGSDPSIDGLAELVRERTAGNPFFIEEIIKTLAESDDLEGSAGAYRLTTTIDQVEIPGSVESVLAARIDRLAEHDKRVLQTAAVVGRRFAVPVLRRVAGLTDEELEAALRSLSAAELVFRQSSSGEGDYVFKHFLTAQVAYRSRLASRRAEVHGEVAVAIEELYCDSLDEQAALIAHHWERAGEALAAARWTARAASWAASNDPREAARRWREVQRLLDPLPRTPEGEALALTASTMRLMFAWRLGVLDDQTPVDFGQEAAQVYREGRRLAEQGGRLDVQAILATIYAALREMGGHAAEELAMDGLTLARQTGDRALQLAVLPAPVKMLYERGRYLEVIALADEMIALAGEDVKLGAGRVLTNPFAFLLIWRGLAHAFSGRLEEGRYGLQRALSVAQEQGDVEVGCWSHQLLTKVADLGGAQAEEALKHARMGAELAERTGGNFSRVSAYCSLGLAHLLGEEWTAAIAELEESLAIARQRRVGLELEPQTLSYLARARLGEGQPGGALQAAGTAVGLAQQRRTKGWELLARLALSQALRVGEGASASAAIESELQHSLALVEETGAHGVEPRVHVELAELARLRGEETRSERELRIARGQFLDIGAPARAERVLAGAG